MNNIKEKLIKQARDEAKKKEQKRIKSLEREIENDINTIEKLSNLVLKNILYKKVNKDNPKYVLVTPEILFEDYHTKGKYNWQNKIEIKTSQYDNLTYVNMNGVTYYHIGMLIRKYKNDLDELMEKSMRDYDLAKEKKDLIEAMEKEQPAIIDLITKYLDWNKE